MGILNFYPGMTRRMFTSEVRLEAGISHLTMYLIRIAVYILLQKYKKKLRNPNLSRTQAKGTGTKPSRRNVSIR